MAGEGPLADLRVIAVEQFGAGPWATMQLADLGADVIKIEDPASRGDVGRYVPPYQEGEDSLYFEAFNRGKRSLSLDLRVPEARGVLEDVAREADCLFANLRGTTFTRLRLHHRDFAHVNPALVCCSLSGFGLTGPRAAEGAYDHVVQGLSGWMSLTGGPDEPPLRSGVSMADYAAGYVAALAMVAGVWQARRTGEGCDCDISLFESALAQLNYLATWTLSAGFESRRLRGSAHQSIVPFQTFATQDGWIVIAAPKPGLWVALTEALGLPELAGDPAFEGFQRRLDARDELVALIEDRLGSAPTAVWLERLRGAGVPCGPVNDVAAAFADEQAVARDVVREVAHPVLGEVSHVASPLRLGGAPAPTGLAPRRGEHQSEILGDLCGYGTGRIDALRAAGAFGP
jgi:crotonobetainyl-CoA:carnitine CoA-transferase CaiB-like acyl-CoA transferase